MLNSNYKQSNLNNLIFDLVNVVNFNMVINFIQGFLSTSTI